MSWKKDIEELKQREALAEQMGGEERVARQKAMGKLTARERVDALLDKGSFHETGKIAGRASYGADNEMKDFLPTPFVVGRGLIDGRFCAPDRSPKYMDDIQRHARSLSVVARCGIDLQRCDWCTKWRYSIRGR